MCGRELLKWRWRLTYFPCPQLHNIHSDSKDALNMLFLCGVWISKRKEDASIDDSLGQEVKLCEKVIVLCEKRHQVGEFCPIATFSTSVCSLLLGQILHSCQDTAKNEGQRKENTEVLKAWGHFMFLF